MNSAWDKVLLARDSKRPTANVVIKELFTDFIELHGDRLIGDDKSIIGGIAFLNGIPVTIIAQEKGVTTDQKIYHNFGMPHPEGYHKAIRLMKQAEKFNRPIITFIDTPGAYPGIGAEERGQANAIAVAIKEMMNISVPIISVVLGEGGSGGALAIGIANTLAMFENSIYSVISPEGFASILYKDAKMASDAAEDMRLTAQDLYEFKIIDNIILEKTPLNIDYKEGFKNLNNFLKKEIVKLQKMSKDQLLKQRYDKFRKIGVYQELIRENVDSE